MMTANKRLTSRMEEGFVVFLIGMRVNAWWKPWRWVPVAAAMPRMVAELSKKPDLADPLRQRPRTPLPPAPQPQPPPPKLIRGGKPPLAVALDRGGDKKTAPAGFAVVQVPSVLGRFVEIPHPTARHAYILLEDVIALFVGDLFPSTRVLGVWPFRVTRNFDLNYDEEESEDLLKTIQKEVRRRDPLPHHRRLADHQGPHPRRRDGQTG